MEVQYAPTVCDRCIIDLIEMEMNEMSFIGSSATTSWYVDVDGRVRDARNQNREQRNGLIENLRRYVGQNMLGLNANQDDDI
jgi:chromatin remodeling complex protein RSC6